MPTATLKPTELIQQQPFMPSGMIFYGSLDSVMQDESLLGYFSVMKRAWFEMKLNGVFFLDGCPVLYLKEYKSPVTTRERLYYHRLFWNQGIANILVLADPESVYIYSGLAKPAEHVSDESSADNALVEKIRLVDYAQRHRSLLYSLSTGRYYEINENQQKFDPEQAVDSRLLKNLRALRDSLTQGEYALESQKAHALIGRVLFLCYLLDRNIYPITQPDNTRTGTVRFAKRLEERTGDEKIDFLYSIFSELKEHFNGNMFDQDLDAERRVIQTSHLDIINLFLGGHDVTSGQLSFWPYDFKMIPVETISAIYQDFLSVEDQEKQRKRGAFYTPRFLAEMVVDIAVREDPKVLDGAFIDPACGSGIFLVILFARLANRWLMKNNLAHYTAKAKAFREILSRQIHGVDLEETACRIACFSLYLAYLDFFDPPDIQEHIKKTGRPLPKLLDYGIEKDRPEADIPVIYKADFLKDEMFAGQRFDCVIGNPPWEGRGSKQLAQKFVQKTPALLAEGGIGCLLLPSKILQNQTDAFQAEWLTQVTLESVLQLADYSFLLFQNALCPAIIARFKNNPPQVNHHNINYSAPKFNRDGLRQGIIKVNPSARTQIPLLDILTATRNQMAPVSWKRRLWGTPRDQKLLDLLQSMPSLKENVDILSASRKKKQKRMKDWVIGQGLKPWAISKKKSDRKPKKMAWPPDMAFIDARLWNNDVLVLRKEISTLITHFEKKKYRTDILYSQPPLSLFKAPMVLVSQGFNKVSFSDFDVLFQHSIQSIVGPPKDEKLLMFLAVYLRSKLARYFLFHTSANWGSERDKVHLSELLRVPLPLPGSEFVSPNGKLILDNVFLKTSQFRKSLTDQLEKFTQDITGHALFDDSHKRALVSWYRKRKLLVDQFQSELEPLIYEYFGLTDQEIALVEDTVNIFIPSSTPTNRHSSKLKTLDPVEKSNVSPYEEKGLGTYADVLTKTLNKWAETENSDYRVHAKGGTDLESGIAMVTVSLGQGGKPFQSRPLSNELSNVLAAYHSSISTTLGTVEYDRDIFFFNGNKLHIIRPNLLINWTRTAALNDAARIYGDIISANRERK
jgi:hypothetical protein